MEEKTHARLVMQLRNGSKDAFTKLYMLHSEQLYGFVFRLTKSPAEAEDILQEAFLRIWNNRNTLSEKESFKSYLFKISYHLVIDSFRKQINSIDLESYIRSDYYQKASDNSVETKLNIDDYRRLINQSVSRLTPRQQEIFRLSREEELSSKEISKKLGISEKTVNNQLSIILATIKTDLLLAFLLCVL